MTAGYQLRVTDDACSGLRLHLAVCVGECLFELTLGRTWTDTQTLAHLHDRSNTHTLYFHALQALSICSYDGNNRWSEQCTVGSSMSYYKYFIGCQIYCLVSDEENEWTLVSFHCSCMPRSNNVQYLKIAS